MSETAPAPEDLQVRSPSWVATVLCLAIAGAGLISISLGFDGWLPQRLPPALLRPGPSGKSHLAVA